MKKKVLVAGFGLMGCRHVQAFLQEKDKFEVHVLEPSEENIKTNLARIGATEADCKFYSKLEDVPVVDLAVVATSSKPRYAIVKTLLEKGVKLFLLEKIVFQSKQQFDEIIALMNNKGAQAYCNFVNRYFNAYNEIKPVVSGNKEKIEMTVYGGTFGLGCNSVHYIDIFQYITADNNITISNAELQLLDIENRRGAEYKEFVGAISVANGKQDVLSLIADKEFKGGTCITIKQGNKTYLLSEETQRYFEIENNTVKNNAFTITPTSRLSNVIAEDIFSNKCKLTKLEDTYRSHIGLFNKFNNVLGVKESLDKVLCPIT